MSFLSLVLFLLLVQNVFTVKCEVVNNNNSSSSSSSNHNHSNNNNIMYARIRVTPQRKAVEMQRKVMLHFTVTEVFKRW